MRIRKPRQRAYTFDPVVTNSRDVDSARGSLLSCSVSSSTEGSLGACSSEGEGASLRGLSIAIISAGIFEVL